MQYVGYLLILLYSALNLCESIIVKRCANKHGNGGMIFNSIICLFALCFFLITDEGGFYIPSGMPIYAVLNSIFYASGFYLTFVAYRIGPFGLTKLISTFSLLFPILYGILFLEEQPGVTTYIGLVMILSAVFIINYKKSSETDRSGISAKWLVCVLVSVISNGCISIMTRAQQIKFDNSCSNEFSVFSLAGAFLILLIIGVITDRGRLGGILRHGMLYGAAAGIANGAKNFVTLFIYLYLPLSTVSPIKTGLGILITFLTSLLYYKEKYSRRQLIGVVIGTVAVVMLAIK
jgi:drug/metabolite transporter (DMT)-like permease